MPKAWTPEQARAEFATFCKSVGTEAAIFVNLTLSSYERSRAPIHATLYPNGLVRDAAFTLYADNFEDLHADVLAKWAEFSDEHTRRTIRRMALAIIEITADQGACSDAGLRQAGFSQADIDRHGARACTDANEIASNGPFEIATAGKANAEAA